MSLSAVRTALLVPAFSLALAACDGARPPSATRSAPPTWTVLVYMGGDNNLERAVLDDLNEMEAAALGTSVNVVVEMDTQTLPLHGSLTTRRLRIVPDADPATVTSPVLQDLGERDMSDPAELADFVVWGATTFPADRYALVLWDHGGQWSGVVQDFTPGTSGRLIDADALASALATARSGAGLPRFELIGFDACLMAGVEVYHALEPHALIAVGSEENEPADGWAYDAWLTALARDTRAGADAVGRAIADSYFASLPAGPSQSTLSVVDLRALPDLVVETDELAAALLTRMATLTFVDFAPARRFAIEWGRQRPYDPALSIDLHQFASILSATTADSRIRAACDDVADAVGRAVLYSRSGNPNAGGISIYFPNRDDVFAQDYLATSFAQQNAWSQFLAEYHFALAADVTPVGVSILATTPAPAVATPTAPLTVDLATAGADLYMTTVEMFLSIFGGVASLATFDITGSSSFDWAADVFVLSDGSERNYLPMRRISPHAPLFVAEADLVAPFALPLTLVIGEDPSGARALLGAIERNDDIVAAPFLLLPGDELNVRLPFWDASAGWTFLTHTTSVTVGTALPAVQRAPAPAGSYVLSVFTEDFAENFASDEVAVTVP